MRETLRDRPQPALVALAVTALAALAALTAAAPAAAGDWPRFRGPAYDGISKETGLLDAWPETGPRERWRVTLGAGYAGLAVAGGRLYTLHAEDTGTYATARDVADGQEVWRHRLDRRWDDRMGNGPRATPTVDGGRVFVLSGRGTLAALDRVTGSPEWTVDLVETYGARIPQWGVAASPLVDGDRLIVQAGGKDGRSVVALDKATGKTVWTALDDKPGYAAPIVATLAGRRQLLVFTGEALVGLDPENGRALWREPWKTSYDVNAATPIPLGDDRVFVSSGYDTGAAVFRIERAGDGLRSTAVWRERAMKNQFSSSVLRDGKIYGFDDKTLKCIDAATGATLWRARGFGHGSLLWADGKLVVLGDAGNLALVRATPDAYEPLAEFQLFRGKTWTVPTLSGGVLYVRDENELVALNVAG